MHERTLEGGASLLTGMAVGSQFKSLAVIMTGSVETVYLALWSLLPSLGVREKERFLWRGGDFFF